MSERVRPSEYEARARQQIHDFKNPGESWLDRALTVVSSPLDKTANVVLNAPGVGPAMQAAFSGTLSVINDVSQWSIRPEAVLDEYRKATSKPMRGLRDIHKLELERVDDRIGWLDAKYKGLALAEGAAAGAAGTLNPALALALIPADVVALTTLNLRAVGEYATYCGFDISSQAERLFALNILAHASSPTDSSKQVVLAQLARIARDVALHKSWMELERHAAVKAIQQLARALSIRMTRTKLAQVLPVAGAAIGGGFNAYYTDKVCRAAFHLYRERFLAEKARTRGR